jgi:5'-methylthioadenosine phosphorylase
MTMRTIGVIGGSGLYEMEGLRGVERKKLETPWGEPSDEYVLGALGDARLAFLPRHGRGHRILPHEINFRANIHGMKQLGVERIIAVSAVGSMREDIRPGDLVVVDQFFDRTQTRPQTFFGDGIAGHVALADPVCRDLGDALWASASALGLRVHRGGTYLCIEGPQFSTRAESRIYRQWGVDVIGMTNLPEARLAREAEICYATVALATDYDCWHEAEGDVTIEAVIEVLRRNVDNSRALLRDVAGRVPAERRCTCRSAARDAILTERARITPEARRRTALLFGKYL